MGAFNTRNNHSTQFLNTPIQKPLLKTKQTMGLDLKSNKGENFKQASETPIRKR